MAIDVVDAKFVSSRIGELPIIDVRRPEEFLAGHIPSALNAMVTPRQKDPEYGSFIEAVEGLVPKKEQPLIVYCRRGVRSRVAAQILENAGYERIFDYSGSWQDWIRDPSRPIAT